jgi:glycosyltransferase involved in cell wall biosynthesis
VQLTGRLSESISSATSPAAGRVVFPPFDEDYGFVTVEAFASARRSSRVMDSGGPAEIVEDGASGLVVEPTARRAGAGLRRVIDDREGAARMGQAGAAFAARLTWPATLSRLLLPVN